MSAPVYRRGPRQVYGQRRARGWVGSRAVVAGASLLPRQRTLRQRPPPQLHARLPRRLILGASPGFLGLPVQAPTFAIPVSSANELFALTGANRENGATAENSVDALVGANRGSPNTTSNDAEVP